MPDYNENLKIEKLSIELMPDSDGRWYYNAGVEINGKFISVYPDFETPSAALRALADEIENPQ
tara:strand:+ start:100 stop:288 length:189 start_codon:yes stop_codon:yes gene_type:complete